ncbi:hypothetical protein COI93_18465 [Bacillus cereus]|uniref:Endospore appendages core domain-containing protein n=1 Tax=Bacillus cereus TaxID=1396 RepID=A0A2B0LRE7_BACCE|nr:hypothetical protein COI93_18465 [Bacillus cereus]
MLWTNNSALSCCTSKTFVQDQACSTWGTTVAGDTIIYTNNIAQEIFASGYIKYDAGADSITVTFLNGTTTVDSLTIPPQGSSTFTQRGFDTIQVTTASAGAHQGEICLTVRYSLS